MPEPTSEGRRAQHSCARGSQYSRDALELVTGDTLDAQLASFLRAHSRAWPCTWSVPELAAQFAPNQKPDNGERSVRRALVRVAHTNGTRFHEEGRTYRRITLTVARWIESEIQPGAKGRSRKDRRASVASTLGPISRVAKADQPRAARAPRVTRRPEKPARRPARPHGVSNPAILTPLALEVGVLEAVRAAHGARAVRELVHELQRPRCHAHADEARLAARTLAARSTDTPLRLFRHLFSQAIGGDLLIDKPAEIERTVRAELEGMLDTPLEELEERLAAVSISGGDPWRILELERAIRARRPPPPPSRPHEHTPRDVRPPLTRQLEPEPIVRKLDPARGAAYVATLPEKLRHLFRVDDTS